MKYKRLGDILVMTGLITDEQLQHALDIQKKTPDRLGKVLIDNKFITEAQFIEALTVQLGIEYIDLSKITISADMVKVLPKEIAKKYNVIPYKIVNDDLYLVMSDPLNFIAIEEVKNATKYKIVPMISTHNATERAVMTLYSSEGTAKAIEEMKLEMDTDDNEDELYSVMDSDDIHYAPTIRLVNSIIERAINERASDIHIEPRDGELLVRMRIDGVMRNVLTVPKNLQASVISRLKVMGGMNISERKIPQDGRANVKIKNVEVDLRMSTLPTIFGEKTVIRILYKSGSFLEKKSIGLEGENLEKYNSLLKNSSGIVLIVGPTGSGKSSTMYTMINELNVESKNLITLEDPVEYNISGINQCQINEKTGMTFANGLRAILRQDPDIVAVGEMRDGETASIAVRAAITGHLVLSTLHTNDALSTIDRLLDMNIEPYMISSALKGVVSQRLVRKICPHCKEEYKPSEDELVSMRISAKNMPSLKFYKGKGCPECFNTGYLGRTAVFEILVINSEIRKIINAGGRHDDLLAAIERIDFKTLFENCMELVLKGITTVEETVKITGTSEV